MLCCDQFGSSPSGSHNVDLVSQSRGIALLASDRLGVDARNFERYLYQTHPEILSVSPREGSIRGGTLVTITGTGFYPDQLSDSLKVTIGGVFVCTYVRMYVSTVLMFVVGMWCVFVSCTYVCIVLFILVVYLHILQLALHILMYMCVNPSCPLKVWSVV